jgi:hypothetical protein
MYEEYCTQSVQVHGDAKRAHYLPKYFQQQLMQSGWLSHMRHTQAHFLATKHCIPKEQARCTLRASALSKPSHHVTVDWFSTGSATENRTTVSQDRQRDAELRRILSGQRQHVFPASIWDSRGYGLLECDVVQSGRSITLTRLNIWYLQDCGSCTWKKQTRDVR